MQHSQGDDRKKLGRKGKKGSAGEGEKIVNFQKEEKG